MGKEFHYRWMWELNASPEALWPLVSDTNRFNRDTLLPPMQLLAIENGAKRLRFKIPVFRVEWSEEPFEWTYPYRFGILRRYHKGPLAEMRVDCRLERRTPSGTTLIYEVWAKAANPITAVLIPIGIGFASARLFEKTFKLYDRIAARGGSLLTMSGSRKLSAGSRARIQTLTERLRQQSADSPVPAHLAEFLERADDLSVQRIRPYALADMWNLPRQNVLESFLRATRLGLLDMYWDILCPECRGVTKGHSRLSDLSAHSHCNTCQIDFSANFDHNIEVIFRPNASVRAVDSTVEFCVGSPQKQPFKIFSLIVPQGEELPFNTMLAEGRYTLRASAVRGSYAVMAVKDGPQNMEFTAGPEGWPPNEAQIGLQPYIKLVNKTGQHQSFELVRTSWSDQAATAADVTTLQVFRDLFSHEVLRPGEEISVGSATLMFTDLRNSTRLYREIGDASAFGRVREHFDVLQRAITAEGGAIIKTMGDSVMASFRRPSSALRAISNAQQQISEPLQLKAGIHHGPCIVVNLNDRLDYFGSTVNIAARLPHFSNGSEVIFSESIHNDPDVQAFLQERAHSHSPVPFNGELKGYGEDIPLWRLKL
jgi:class 3 adenylate cyclase